MLMMKMKFDKFFLSGFDFRSFTIIFLKFHWVADVGLNLNCDQNVQNCAQIDNIDSVKKFKPYFMIFEIRFVIIH